LRPPRDEPDLVRAAGAVLWRPGPDGGADGDFAAAAEHGPENREGIEVALVHRPRYDDWTFPKGKLKSGEHVLRAVVREVEEETGLTPRLGRRLRSAFYLKDGRPKRVDYWVATVAAEWSTDRFVPNEEVDRLEWLTVEAAAGRLSYPRDVDVLREMAAGPLRTTPYILLRHGSAGEKRDWLGDDVLRPLDPRGREEAGRLPALLSGFGPLRVISSCTARCVETVLPYALHARVSVVTDRAFTVGLATPEGAADRIGDLIADGVPTLVCTHGELLTGLVPLLCARLDGKPPDEPALRKGGFWILHVAHGTLACLERHSA
jgi:8-oxo-dGTP pyrophosphatase MutT (NUDIX family)/phosphohistidine phosphatase SixA